MIEGLTVSAAHIVDGWVKAARAIAAPGFAADHVTIVADGEWLETPRRLRQVDQIADAIGTERPSAVANVLCPSIILNRPGTTSQKLAHGWDLLGRGRQRGVRFSGWRDTYFERLTGHRAPRAKQYVPIKENRLLGIVQKINSWDHNVASSLYAHTDLSTDSLRTRGSPCLQYVQFRVFEQDKIGITAVYRSHDYLSKALGNMIGLQRLARFVAQETQRRFGRVTVVSLAPITEGGKRALRQYADDIAGL